MAHAFTDLLAHCVFSTKGRATSIEDEMRHELFAYLGGVVKRIGGKALLVNGMKDHVHMLLRLPPNVCVSECMRLVKANSSKWVGERWPSRRNFQWQIGYAAFSVSLSQRDAVYKYIRDQANHHRRMSFGDEIAAMLKKHGGDAPALLE